MAQKKCISYVMVTQANSKNAWNTLCYYVWLRAKFQKPLIYNYNCRRIGQLLNISKSSASKHISLMKEFGWVTEKDNHLFLKVQSGYETNALIKIPIHENKKLQILTLKNVLINNNINQQTREIIKKKKIVKNAKLGFGKIDKKQFKNIAKMGGLKKFELSINDRTTLSNKKIALIFGVSKRSASNLQCAMNKSGLIKASQFYHEIETDTFNLPKNAFLNKKGKYVVRLSNTIKTTYLHQAIV